MSIQANDIVGSLQRAQLVQEIHAAHQGPERAAAGQTAHDLERLAQAAEEEVNTSAPTGGKSVHDRDAGAGPGYTPRRRAKKPPPPAAQQAKVKPPPEPPPPREGTILDLEA